VLNVNGVTQVHALAMFTDKTEALVKADVEGHVTTLAATLPPGSGGAALGLTSVSSYSQTVLIAVGGPVVLPPIAFASFSIPAMNARGHHAFLGTRILGLDGATAANSRGIFFHDPAIGGYRPLARTGEYAPGVIGATGPGSGSISAFYDPVLADNGSLAFRALLGGVRATNNDSLWWRPAGGTPNLIAQEGQRPADSTVATEKWLAFPSVAITPGGRPLFTATVTGGASGVWGTDYTGHLRKLFRTGDLIGGRPLAGFAILKAVPGAMGMTRSFNGTQQLVWRAVFRDGTTGIVETIVP
jgi:hypothetical protein